MKYVIIGLLAVSCTLSACGRNGTRQDAGAGNMAIDSNTTRTTDVGNPDSATLNDMSGMSGGENGIETNGAGNGSATTTPSTTGS